ncbi:hypothetical protein [Roseimaritima sediminicola]|uniref:hypothetical protein n=1 Tax=Roseimaritima sediminicola TaxID=2662066 RepID=UPI001F34B61C|nr:hypothetical protein [Roseimaritima sediminicola]
MIFLRRYWVVGLVLAMVVIHAAIISYVRSQVARLKNVPSTTVAVGDFQFQNIEDLSKVYSFRLHVIVDPQRRHYAEERLLQNKLEIHEQVEQLLRQSPPELLDDPTQTVLRDRLIEVLLGQLSEPVIQRVIITGWLELPVSEVSRP